MPNAAPACKIFILDLGQLGMQLGSPECNLDNVVRPSWLQAL